MDEELKNEFEFVDEVEETPRRSGLGTFGAMAIGSGLTLGGIAIVKKVKKVMADKKAQKEVGDDDLVGYGPDDSDSQPEV